MKRILRSFATSTKTKISPPNVLHSRDFRFKSVKGLLHGRKFTPKKVFNYLENHVIGQKEAKRALAIAYSKNEHKCRKQMEKETVTLRLTE